MIDGSLLASMIWFVFLSGIGIAFVAVTVVEGRWRWAVFFSVCLFGVCLNMSRIAHELDSKLGECYEKSYGNDD